MQTAGHTILIVEDNPLKRYTLVRYLKAAGFEVWETSSGIEAIALAQKQPAVIALDVNLPDISGLEVARRLREDPRTASIPIIQISAAFTTSNSKAQGLNSGADTYLTGPVEPEELIATMNAMIRMRRAEALARDFAARWQATFDAISDCVLLLNQDGVVERCNRACSALLNQPAQALVGRRLSELAGIASLDQSVYLRMLVSSKRETIERFENGIWHETTADPVLDGCGSFRGCVLIVTNITDRKHAEEARAREQALLEQEADRLEAKVQERTLQLEESVQSMQGFCYTIAHDLRAPLRAVSGLTSVLIEQYAQNMDEPGRELASRITGAARRMDRMIEELLAFGRLSHSDLPCCSVDLEAVLQSTAAQMQSEIELTEAVLSLKGPFPSVWANPTIVEQIAANLIGNALKFVAPEVRPQVAVRAEAREKWVRIWVEDNGIGIEPAYHAKIFGLFERLHLDKQYRGTGLGLAIVQKGAERMGGSAGVESEPGQGSRFWVELPAVP